MQTRPTKWNSSRYLSCPHTGNRGNILYTIYFNYQIFNNFATKKKTRIIVEKKIHRQTQTPIDSRRIVPMSKDKLSSYKNETKTEIRLPVSVLEIVTLSRCYLTWRVIPIHRRAHPQPRLPAGATGESKLQPDNPNFSSRKNCGGRETTLASEETRKQRRQNGSTRRMIRAKCVVSRVQPCQLTPVLAARQAFDQGTGRPSNEDSPPLLPWYLHYFCGVIKNPVPGVGQRIRQPLSLRRPCFLFAILNVNESFSPLFIFFSLPYILCIGLFLYSGLRKYSNIYRSLL